MKESLDDYILQRDLETLNAKKCCENLRESTVLITGGTGLIGSLLIKTLLCANRLYNTNIRIIAMARSKEKVYKIFGALQNRENLRIIYSDIRDQIYVDEEVNYIIHTASETASKNFISKPVETIQTTMIGTQNILEFAFQKKIKGMVFLSSMEAYGITDHKLIKVSEADLGYIDILSARSSYSESKRMAECLCGAYSSEFNLPVVIARLAQTFGAGVNLCDSRVFAQFARSVIEKKDIVLHTNGESVGNYCYSTDAIEAIFLLLFSGNPGEAYNIVNEENTMTIKEMALMVTQKITNGKIGVIYDIPMNNSVYGYAPNVEMRLSSQKLNELGWKASVDMEETYIRMIESMKCRRRYYK